MAFTPTVNRTGQVNQTGANDALFLKKWSNEILAAYEQNQEFVPQHMRRQSNSMKSLQFPVFGRLAEANGTDFLAVGDATSQSKINGDERTITTDGIVYKSMVLSDVDDVQAHYDVRSVYATQMGESIAMYDNTTVALNMIRAARDSGKAGLSGGSQVTSAASKTDATVLQTALFASKQALDEKFVREASKAYLKPTQYHLLVQSDRLVHSDFTAGSNGGLDTGYIKAVAGLEVVKSLNLPTTNVTNSIGNKYNVDASNTTSIISTNKSVGSVLWKGVNVEGERLIQYKGYYTDISGNFGYDVLRAEDACEIVTA